MRKIEYKYAIGLVTALGLFMAVLDNTIVNVSLTAMQKSFNTTINSIQWVITAYFLTQAAVIPAAGYLGNRIGLKRLFIAALAIFTLGSFLCGISARFGSGGDTLLIAFRIFQGVGGGMLFPLGTAISFGAFPPVERAAASGVIAVPVLLGPTLGPTIGGLIVDSSIGWPGIFYINIPVGIIAIFLFARLYDPDRAYGGSAGGPATAAQRTSFDWTGLASSILGVFLVIYGFNLVSNTKAGTISAQNPRGTINGWGYSPVWFCIAAGLLVLLFFAWYELRVAKDPVLDLKTFRSYNFTVASIVTWVTRAVVFGSFFLIPLFLQQFRGYSAVRTGLILMPQGVAAGIGIAIASRLYDKIGPRIIVAFGMLLLTISTIMLVKIGPTSGAQFFIPILLVRGIGFGASNVPLQTLALSSVTGRALPKASSLYNATAQIFSSIGIAVLTTLLVQSTTSEATSRVASARAAGTPPPANLQVLAGASAMSHVFVIISIGTALAVLVALLLPRRAPEQAAQPVSAGAGAPAPHPVAIAE